MFRVPVIVFALVVIGAGTARAQEQSMMPLAELARQAEAAKTTAKKAKKTYTNASLTADPRGESPTTPAPAATATSAAARAAEARPDASATAATAADAKSEGEPGKESEASWRARAATVRTQVDALRVRITNLTTPNKLRDENPGIKASNDIQIENARSALAELRKQWMRIETSAIQRKIPIEWIQPAPVFPQ